MIESFHENKDKKYYNGEKLLNLLDIDKKEPSVFIASSNRTAGKTTYFCKHFLHNFKQHGYETVFLFRDKTELTSAHSMYSDILYNYPELGNEVTTGKAIMKDVIYPLYIDDELFAYTLSLKDADKIKKYSPVFRNVKYTFMDEYQTESGKYIKNEITAYESIIMSVSRGNGEQFRYVKNIISGNFISLMNPYLIKSGLYKLVNENTTFITTKGWASEFCFNESAAKSVSESAFNRAFDDRYTLAMRQKVFLIPHEMFIEKINDRFQRYLFTIKYDNNYYGVREIPERGILYISKNANKTSGTIITFKASDHAQNTMNMRYNSWLTNNLKEAFNGGYMRFDCLETKNAIFEILAVDMYK